MASTIASRDLRNHTREVLDRVLSGDVVTITVNELAPLPVDGSAARQWAALRVRLRDAGRKVNVNDLWIAAVALANQLPVVTQDDDFDVLAELGLLDVIRV